MRRTLLVIDSLQTGGAERHLVDLACALRAAGETVVVAASARGPLAKELDAAGVPLHVLTPTLVKRRFSLRFALALRGLLAREEFDLVHAHLYAASAAAALAVAGRGVPLVVTEQTEAPWRGRRARLVSRLVYRRADRIVAVSSAIRRCITSEFGVPPAKVAIVRNAVHARGGGRPARNAHPTVGVVARLQPEKGIDVLLRSVERIADAVPDVRFEIVGAGPLRDELESLSTRLGAAERVAFLGERTEARELLPRFDALVLPSRAEGTPLTIVESMLAGTPVVATAVGGIPDQVVHGVTGLLVAPEDSDALARATVAVLRDRQLAERLTRAARRRAEEEFSHSAMLASLEAVYDEVAPHRTRRRGRSSTSSVAIPEPSRVASASRAGPSSGGRVREWASEATSTESPSAAIRAHEAEQTARP